MKIEWNESTFESHSPNCYVKIIGFSCSNCGKFEQIKGRYCRCCGGKYEGEIIAKNPSLDFQFGGF